MVPVSEPPPAVSHVISIFNGGGGGDGGVGGGENGNGRISATMSLPVPPPPPIRLPPPPRNPSDLRALVVQRSFSRDSLNSGSGINHPGRVPNVGLLERGMGHAAATVLSPSVSIGTTGEWKTWIWDLDGSYGRALEEAVFSGQRNSTALDRRERATAKETRETQLIIMIQPQPGEAHNCNSTA